MGDWYLTDSRVFQIDISPPMPIRCRKERCSSLYLFSLETLPGSKHASRNSIFQNARLYQAVHWLSGPCVCIFGPLHWRITKIINVLHETPSTCKKCKYIGEQKMEVCKSMDKFNRVELLVHWSTIALVTEQPEWHHLHDQWPWPRWTTTSDVDVEEERPILSQRMSASFLWGRSIRVKEEMDRWDQIGCNVL